MTAAIKQTVTIQPGGVVHLTFAQLREGRQAEVIVLVTDPPAAPDRLAAFHALQQSIALTPAAATAWIREADADRQAFGNP